MFTGIIEELGKIISVEPHGGGARLKISARIAVKDTNDGDSIAVNGVCLTALDVAADSFAADISQETLNRSTLKNLNVGTIVNLERAVTPSTRLGGHIVQGHVDANGRFLSAKQDGDFWTVRIGYPKEIAPYLIYKGSISVEGISLTVANLTGDYFEIAIIPKTWTATNLSTLKTNDAVNLEADVIAKYVERILKFGSQNENSVSGVTMEKTAKTGFRKMIEILQAETTEQIEQARKLFREYEIWLGISLCFQSFDDEVANLPGNYASPDGHLFLALSDGKPAGCIALRKLNEKICEMKRLFVRGEFRRQKIGQTLIGKVIEEAKIIGYEKMRLDTFPPKMGKAVKLYESYGFYEIAPYYNNPYDGVLFMEKIL